jgi:hypothetical protein
MTAATKRVWSDEYKVDLPEGEHGRAKIQRFEIDPKSIWAMRMNLEGRGARGGVYTRLTIGGQLWMSDTEAEIRDHLDAILEISRRGGRVLINGLGLGMVVKAALACENVEHVDVIESDPDVLALVGPHYASERCTIHEADAMQMKWPVGSRWTVAWHDIWLHMSEDNLPEMARLHRSYGRRVDWQGSWGRERIEAERRRSSGAWWR